MLNWKIATLFHRTEKLHKTTEKTTNISSGYNSFSSGTKSKHRVETIGSLKTGNNEKCSQFKKPENTSAKRISLGLYSLPVVFHRTCRCALPDGKHVL